MRRPRLLTRQISVRVTRTEHAALVAAARAQGCSLSELVRQRATDPGQQQPRLWDDENE